jgi:hypothetical protein
MQEKRSQMNRVGYTHIHPKSVRRKRTIRVASNRLQNSSPIQTNLRALHNIVQEPGRFIVEKSEGTVSVSMSIIEALKRMAHKAQDQVQLTVTQRLRVGRWSDTSLSRGAGSELREHVSEIASNVPLNGDPTNLPSQITAMEQENIQLVADELVTDDPSGALGRYCRRAIHDFLFAGRFKSK